MTPACSQGATQPCRPARSCPKPTSCSPPSSPRLPLSRPPWGCVATPELALDYLGVRPQVLWSYKLRRQGPEVEKDAKRLYRGVGQRNLYRYEAVLSWLPGGEAYVDRPWHWSRRWLSSIGAGQVADDPEAVLGLVERLERTRSSRAARTASGTRRRAWSACGPPTGADRLPQAERAVVAVRDREEVGPVRRGTEPDAAGGAAGWA